MNTIEHEDYYELQPASVLHKYAIASIVLAVVVLIGVVSL